MDENVIYIIDKNLEAVDFSKKSNENIKVLNFCVFVMAAVLYFQNARIKKLEKQINKPSEDKLEKISAE